jgi:hypothetical protein
MSSTMLDQAVIDAEALREAAMKNAEQEVLEKYSGEIKEAVSSLLEQEEDMFGMEDEEGLDDEPGIADQMPIAATDGENMCPCPEEEEPMVLDLDQIVAAAQAAESEEEMDLGGEVAADEEELFEVNDDNLLEAIAQALNEEEDEEEDDTVAKKDFDGDGEVESKTAEWKGSRDKAIKKSKEKEDKPKNEGAEKISPEIFEDSEAKQTYHAAENEGDDDKELRRLRKKKQTSDVRSHEKYLGLDMDADEREQRRDEPGTHFSESDEADLDEELLDEIVEALVVDMKNVPSGDMFHTHPTMGQNERGLDIALAQEQDTEFAEEQKELRQALKKLQEQVKSQKLKLNKQKKDFDNLKSIALKATKKLEEVNFSNAKLIYTNRILKSDSLNERQKEKLVEAISKVGSVEEAKIVYDTLNENLSSKSRTAPKTLNEAVNKNNPLILKSNKEKLPAGQNQVDRLKRLAGII